MKNGYYNIPKIDVYAIFNEAQNIWAIKILKTLGIELKKELYTEYEFDCLRVDVAEYYENEKNLPFGITKENYKKIRNILDDICY